MNYAPTILTADGVYFDYTAPNVAAFTLNSIARGLANTCRFGGQCARFYSVAEHSIWVSRLVSEEHAIAGLFHDAAEAFITDVPKPLKELLPDYKAVEERVEAVLFPFLGVPLPLPAAVKAVDRVMLATEQRDLMKNRDEWKWTGQAQPLDISLACLSPEAAYGPSSIAPPSLEWRCHEHLYSSLLAKRDRPLRRRLPLVPGGEGDRRPHDGPRRRA
jgi:hypothetical protein